MDNLAIDQLRIAAETAEHNAPIHRAAGDTAQADLCEATAASCREAIEKLNP